jgi:AcrR family transcriptional regulator
MSLDPAIEPPRPFGAPLQARLAAAVLAIADEGGWPDATLREVARRAEAPLGEVFAFAPGKSALVDAVSNQLDLAAFLDEDPEAAPADRLFEAVMARLEAMEPHRTALAALLREEGATSARTAIRLARTARAVLEAAGIGAEGRRGALRLALTSAVLARTFGVWRDDEGALNRTMAELDRRLKQMSRALDRFGAGYSTAK